MTIGSTEIIIILVAALLIFGPKNLPQLAKILGKTISAAKRQLNAHDTDWESGKTAETHATRPSISERNPDNRTSGEGIAIADDPPDEKPDV